MYNSKNMDSKLFDIASCTALKHVSLVAVYAQPGTPIHHQFGSDPRPDLKWRSRTLAYTNLIPPGMASRPCQLSCDPYDLSSDDEDNFLPNNVAGTTTGQSNRSARLLTPARLHSNSPPKTRKNWGRIDPNLNAYHFDQIEIHSWFAILDLTDWCCQPKKTHSKYPDLSNVGYDIFFFIPHGVDVEASFSFGQDVIVWRQ